MTSVQGELSAQKVGVKTIEDSEYNVILEENSIKFQTGGNVLSMAYDGNSIGVGNVFISPDSISIPVLEVTGSVNVPNLALDHYQLSNVATSDHHLNYLPRDGSRPMQANLNFGGTRGINMGNAISPSDSVAYGQLLEEPRLTRENCIVVSKNPGYGEYSTIAEGYAAAVDRGTSVPITLFIKDGIYDVKNVLVLDSSNVNIEGESELGTTIRMVGSEPVFDIREIGAIINLKIKAQNYTLGDGIIFSLAPNTRKLNIKNVTVKNFQRPLNFDNVPTRMIFLDSITTNGDFETAITVSGTPKMRITNSRLLAGRQTTRAISLTSGSPYVELNSNYLEGNNNRDSIAIEILAGECESIGNDIQQWDIGVSLPNDNQEFFEAGSHYDCRLYDISVTSTSAIGYSYAAHDHLKTLIRSNAFYLFGKNPKIISVGSKGADYTSLKTAILTEYSNPATFSESRIFDIGPETLFESEIPTYYGMAIKGRGENATVIVTPDPTKPVFIGNAAVILENLTVAGSYMGAAAIYNPGHPTINRALIVRRCNITGSYIGVHTRSTPDRIANTALIESYAIDSTGMDTVIFSESTGVNPKKCYTIVANFLLRDIESEKETNFIRGEGDQCAMTISAVQGLIKPGRVSSTAVKIDKGASADILSMVCDSFYDGIVVGDSGGPPTVQATGVILHCSHLDIDVRHPTANGYISCSVDSEKIALVSDTVKIHAFDNSPNNPYGHVVVGDSRIGIISDGAIHYYNESEYVRSVLPRGGVSGGVITVANSTTINISSGRGFALNPNDHSLREVEWPLTPYTFSADGIYYIGFNYLGNVIVSNSMLSTHDSIVLGKVIVNGSTILDVEEVDNSVHGAVSHTIENLKSRLGTTIKTGGVVTVNSNVITVTAGSAFNGADDMRIDLANVVTFKTTWLDGTTWNYSESNVLPYQYSNAGVLTPITTFTKNTLWVKPRKRNSNTFYLVINPQQFASSTLAENSSLVNPPSWFNETIIPIASFVQSSSAVEKIVDERAPVSNSGSSGAIQHSDLTGLTVDDHPQYLLVNGNRSFGGNFDMGNNVIINVSTINGVNIVSHATRHSPDGADPLATGPPVEISDFAISSGAANFYARSDHVHPHGARGGGNLHSLATTTTAGFMSPTEKILLGNVGNANGLALLDSTGNISINQIPSGNVVGLGANSLLARGTANSFARSDHVHSIATSAPIAIVPNQTISAGTSNALARADHVHSIATGSPTRLQIGGSNEEGSANTFARSDHVHSISFTNAYVGGSTNITTTNPSLVTMSGMTYTAPDTGTYWVNFTGSFVISSTTGICTLAIFSGSVEQAASRVVQSGRSTSVTGFSMATQAIVTASAGQVLDLRWSTNTGSVTVTNTRRSFSVIRLA